LKTNKTYPTICAKLWDQWTKSDSLSFWNLFTCSSLKKTKMRAAQQKKMTRKIRPVKVDRRHCVKSTQ
jgi:hypothetical protein